MRLEEKVGKVKPFLRWAGGKSWLLKHLANINLSNYNNYHELFLGGGATFFYFKPQTQAFLSDLNGELIETYKALQGDVSLVIKTLKTFEDSREVYYEVRQKQFDTPHERAARFIFLNQTSFNGIYRVNSSGIYNVPYGNRNRNFIDEQLLYQVNMALKNCLIFQSDFENSISNIQARDLVFIDPPYTVSHNNNGFIAYNEKIFSLEDQIRLSAFIDKIKEIGAYYILTNAAHKKIEEIFEKGDRRITLTRSCTIGGFNARRAEINEYIFTNTNL